MPFGVLTALPLNLSTLTYVVRSEVLGGFTVSGDELFEVAFIEGDDGCSVQEPGPAAPATFRQGDGTETALAMQGRTLAQRLKNKGFFFLP